MNLHTYLPQDRLRALARGETLPDRTQGSALFADISGFTPLTENLRTALGPRRGAEELTKHLDAVFAALIAAVEGFGGSVIGFAGDAITCWFDETHGPAAPRATACALALQQAMTTFAEITLPNGVSATLALKVTVASGPARRFVVGDPQVHYLDTLAGVTVARSSTAEHLAQKGEVLLDEATVQALGRAVTVREWRGEKKAERFAVLAQFPNQIPLPVWPASGPLLAAIDLQGWVHSLVVQREQSGHGSFLTEFRPCVALFVRFLGIDFDAAEAEAQLDAFMRHAQTLTRQYESTLMQLTIGDKGSYFYLNLGALSVHEDDPRRAVKIALELQAAASQLGYLSPLQVGITQGLMLVGTFGGPTRRTYGSMGDDVNLAARLMETAAPGEVLVSGYVQKATANDFVFEPRQPLPMKGKAEPLPVFSVTGERQQRAIRLQEPTYALPMVGRQAELQIVNDKLDLTLHGNSQVIGIAADAGMG
ncbi:MAG TPA: adenylate/guanylate cyclase domain-containing protein, partial [Anaerolineales bacterium]